MGMTRTVKAKDIKAGDWLCGPCGSRLRVEDATLSVVLPASVKIETEIGVIYAHISADMQVLSTEHDGRLRCPVCESWDVAAALETWWAAPTSYDEPDAAGSLDEHQCRDCGISFWMGSELADLQKEGE